MNGSWWYVSTSRVTFAVKVEDGVLTEAPPIARRFIGQPSKNFGKWMRSMGDVKFERIADHNPYALTHTYSWGNNEKRKTLKGRHCRIVARGAMRSVLVEFDDGQREIVSIRALRKERDA